MKESLTHRGFWIIGWRGVSAVSAALASFCLLGDCRGQGTIRITFEGPAYPGGPQPQPPGTYSSMFEYGESGILFTVPHHPYSLLLIGSGLSGDPDNGTAYLATFLNTTVVATFPSGTQCGLASVDAVELSLGGILHVVGYRHDGTTVTNDFLPWVGQSFHTLQFSSGFVDLDRVDVSGGWAFDNLVVGIPEPRAGVLTLLGMLTTLRWLRPEMKRRSFNRSSG